MRVKIGLVGAPGSGKSELAEALRDHYIMNDECECRTPVEILDNYAVETGKATDLDVGFEGGYLANLAVAMERISCERTTEAKTYITCGTLLETSCYVAGYVESHRGFWQTDQEISDNGKRIQATLMTLACFYMDTFQYDQIYYLPPIPPVEDERISTLDRNLQAAFTAFEIVPSIPLAVEGTDVEEVTAKRMELIAQKDREYLDQILKEENALNPERAGATASPAE